MKFVKSPELTKYIEELNDINQTNMAVSSFLLETVNNFDLLPEKEINNQEYIKDILNYFEISENDELVDEFIIPSIKEINTDEYSENPYFKNIKIKNKRLGQYELIYDHYEPYEIFPLDDIDVDDNYKEHTHLGYFKNKYDFIALNQKDVTWMNITPNEINTMKQAISKVKGRVIVFGLGLGYFPYMISLKENVKEIVIIEKDKTIIDIFNKELLPQFQNKEKIKIVEADAFNYLKKIDEFDYAFIDLWHNAEDGIELYLHFKNVEKNLKHCKCLYWLEKSFYAFLRRAFISLVYEQYNNIEINYNTYESSFDKIINRYFKLTKNLTISSKVMLQNLLKDDSLLSLIINE